jgi:hypothetical protein
MACLESFFCEVSLNKESAIGNQKSRVGLFDIALDRGFSNLIRDPAEITIS